tara:strand:- start:344 stop:469 length:126 start_codon:yes stop_codon:yes gene_type:complete
MLWSKFIIFSAVLLEAPQAPTEGSKTAEKIMNFDQSMSAKS